MSHPMNEAYNEYMAERYQDELQEQLVKVLQGYMAENGLSLQQIVHLANPVLTDMLYQIDKAIEKQTDGNDLAVSVF